MELCKLSKVFVTWLEGKHQINLPPDEWGWRVPAAEGKMGILHKEAG